MNYLMCGRCVVQPSGDSLNLIPDGTEAMVRLKPSAASNPSANDSHVAAQ